jgi:hypothetical protein
MRNTRSDKKKLENIGRGLLAAGALRESEIEKIAAREDLFSGVLARVKAAPAPVGAQPFSFARFVRRHELALGGALAAVLCVGVLGLYLQVRSDEISLREVPAPGVQPETARFDAPAQPVKHDIAPASAPDRVVDEPEATAQPAPERTIYRQSRPSAQPRPQRASLNETTEPEFYPVTYAGDNGELTRGGRVIRVDVSRATLFAMGINVPLENESPTVKADLVIGPDGVTRAIRLVE